MEKLLDIVSKLREEIVPDTVVTKMGKKDLLDFIEEAKLLDRMRIFHDKRKTKAVTSIIHEDQEESVVPTESELKRMTTGQLRRLVREFHKDIGINQKHAKMSASKLRSFISRHKYTDMLEGDDLKFLRDMDESPKKEKKSVPKIRGPDGPKVVHGMPSIIINNGVASPTEEKEPCLDASVPDDDVGIIKSLAPELFKVLTSRSYLLDMCNLARMKREHDVCPVSCDTIAFNSHQCCKKPDPCECNCCVGVGAAGARGAVGATGAASGTPSADTERLRGGGPGPGPGAGGWGWTPPPYHVDDDEDVFAPPHPDDKPPVRLVPTNRPVRPVPMTSRLVPTSRPVRPVLTSRPVRLAAPSAPSR